MKRRTLLVGLALLAGLSTAEAQPARPEGKVYTPGPFDTIEISGSAWVTFTQGPVDAVTVFGGDEQLHGSVFRVRDGRLVIDQSGSWKFWESGRMRVEVTARELRRVTISGAASFLAPAPVRADKLVVRISGAGSARFHRLDAESLTFDISGHGEGTVAGSVQKLSLDISGRGDFRGAGLRAERSAVAIAGVGDVEVWAVQDLAIAVAGIGKVDYWGTPASVRRSISGAATINDRGARDAPR